MTPQKRAERTVELIKDFPKGEVCPWSTMVEIIAAQIEVHHFEMVSAALTNGTLWTQEDVRKAIEEAEREAEIKGQESARLYNEIISEAFERGFNAAREKVLSFCKESIEIGEHEDVAEQLAERIRKMEA